MFSLVLTFKRYEDAMIFCVFIFIFCLEPTEREQLDENDFRHYYGNFSEAPFWKYLITAMFKVLSKQLRGTLTTAFERHMTVKNFTDMDHHRCQLFLDLTSLKKIDKSTWKIFIYTRIWAYSWKNIGSRHFTYYCMLLFCSNKPSF